LTGNILTSQSQLTVAKQQLQTQGKRATPYDHVKPRVHTVSKNQGSM